MNRSKNSRFWGVRRRATGAFYQTSSPHRHATVTSTRPMRPGSTVGCRAVATEIEQLEHDAVADESRSLTFRSRGTVYVVAGVLLLVCDRARGAAGRRAGRAALRLAGAGARSDAGLQRAPPHLVVGPPDPRARGSLTGSTSRASGLQQDLRRGAAPRHARGGRRLFLGRRRRLSRARSSRRWVRARSAPTTSGSRSAIAIATVPAAIAGALGESAIEDHLGQPWQICISLAFFAILLCVADRRPRGGDDQGSRSASASILIGVSQILALMPGVSRSGITITTGRFSRLEPRRERALLVPAADPDRPRRGHLQGPEARGARAAAGRLDRAVHRRHDRRRRRSG